MLQNARAFESNALEPAAETPGATKAVKAAMRSESTTRSQAPIFSSSLVGQGRIVDPRLQPADGMAEEGETEEAMVVAAARRMCGFYRTLIPSTELLLRRA